MTCYCLKMQRMNRLDYQHDFSAPSANPYALSFRMSQFHKQESEYSTFNSAFSADAMRLIKPIPATINDTIPIHFLVLTVLYLMYTTDKGQSNYKFKHFSQIQFFSPKINVNCKILYYLYKVPSGQFFISNSLNNTLSI